VVGKLVGVVLGVAVAGILIGFYIANFLLANPPTYQPQATRAGTHITIQTVAAVGPQLSPHPDWVSYAIRNNGRWERSTIWKVPANTLVHVTVYQFDGASGLRNPFLAQTQGLVGQATLDGKPFLRIKPDDASHTFAIPELGVLVPLKKGTYRWQCFVPCAAGFQFGFGGPMQTIGYMDGFIHVV